MELKHKYQSKSKSIKHNLNFITVKNSSTIICITTNQQNQFVKYMGAACSCLSAQKKSDSTKNNRSPEEQLKEFQKAREAQSIKKQGDEAVGGPNGDPGSSIPQSSAPIDIAARFTQQDLQLMTDQTQFEDYFLESIIADQQEIALKLLDHNNQQSRQSVRQVADLERSILLSKLPAEPQRLPCLTELAKITLKRRYAQQQLTIVLKTKIKTYDTLSTPDLVLWNPLLLMLAKNHQEPFIKAIQTRGIQYMHFASSLSKPYSKQKQAAKAFSQAERVKRECFGLKLAIYNQNTELLKFMLNGSTGSNRDDINTDQLSQIWNLGHVLEAARLIIKTQWTKGLRTLFAARRVKQIVMSINDPQSYFEFLGALIELLFSNKAANSSNVMPQMQTEFLAALDKAPYIFTKIMICLYLRTQPDTIQALMTKLERDAMPFFTGEIEAIFKKFDPQGVYSDVKMQLQALCDKATDTEDQITQTILLTRVNIRSFVERSKCLSIGETIDSQTIDKLIDDMYALLPFAYKSLGAGGGGNIAVQILESGNDQIIDYLYGPGSECNIRSLLLAEGQVDEAGNQGSRFEIVQLLQKVGPCGISLACFGPILQHEDFMNKFILSFIYLIDQMSLKPVSDLLHLVAQDDKIGTQNQLTLFQAMLESPKFRCLFTNSLEMDKYAFVGRLSEIVDDPECWVGARYGSRTDTKRLHEIAFKQNPDFRPYLDAIKKEDNGDQYSAVTDQEIQKRRRSSEVPPVHKHVIDPDDQQIGLHQSVAVSNFTFHNNPQANWTFAANDMKQKMNEGNIDNSDVQESADEDPINDNNYRNSQQPQRIQINRDSSGNDRPEKESRTGMARNFEQRRASPLDFEEQSKPMCQIAESNNMQLDMGVLIHQQENSSLPVHQGKRPEHKTPEVHTSEAGENARPSDSGEDELKQDARNGLTPDDIQLQFEELENVRICSEISIAYHELIEGFKTSSLQVEDVQELFESYYLNPFDHVQVNHGQHSDDEATKKKSIMYPDKYLWNTLLFAVSHDQTEIVEYLLYSKNFDAQVTSLAILRPAKTNQEYHIMEQKYAKYSEKGKMKRGNQNKEYNQFAIQMAINNRNAKMFALILDRFRQSFTCSDLCEIAEMLIGCTDGESGSHWQEGMKFFLKSSAARSIFVHLRPEDKELFLADALIEPILSAQQTETDLPGVGSQAGQSTSGASQYLKMVVKELKAAPYNSYCALRYPQLLQKYGKLDKSLASITENDVIVYFSAHEENIQRLESFSKIYEQKKQTKHIEIYKALTTARDKKAKGELIEPNDPRQMLKLIQAGDTQAFIRYYEDLKSKAGPKANNLGDASERGISTSRSQFTSENEDLLLFRYLGLQIEAQDQIHEVDYIPQEEALQQLLYDIDDETLSQRSASMNTTGQHSHLLNQLKQKVIHTEQWNPLIFAIYYGRQDIVRYILAQTDHQQLYYLLSDPFRVEEENADREHGDPLKASAQIDGGGDAESAGNEATEFLLENSELLPLVICLITKDSSMFSLVWNQPLLWNKQIYLILLGNIVFETQTPALIRAFLLSSKTKALFNSISLCEKQKFVQFTIKSLEQQIDPDADSQFGQGFSPSNSNYEAEQAEIRGELEQILNVEMLSQPPYSLVNLTENLMPLNLDSTYEDLLDLIEQYRKSPESREILELSLKNLLGGADTPNHAQKWILINTNQMWAKKLSNLIEEVAEQQPELYQEFRFLELLQMDIFKEILNFNAV